MRPRNLCLNKLPEDSKLPGLCEDGQEQAGMLEQLEGGLQVGWGGGNRLARDEPDRGWITLTL